MIGDEPEGNRVRVYRHPIDCGVSAFLSDLEDPRCTYDYVAYVDVMGNAATPTLVIIERGPADRPELTEDASGESDEEQPDSDTDSPADVHDRAE